MSALITGSKVCSICHQVTRSKWHGGKNGSTLKCSACYQRAIRAHSNSSRITCSVCPATQSSQWHTDENNNTLRKCDTCYRKALAARINSSGITCSTCPTTQSSKWHGGKKESPLKCNICYRKALAERSNSSGIACSICRVTKSSRWHDRTLKKCDTCYRSKRTLCESKISEKNPDSASLSFNEDDDLLLGIVQSEKKPRRPKNSEETEGTTYRDSITFLPFDESTALPFDEDDSFLEEDWEPVLLPKP